MAALYSCCFRGVKYLEGIVREEIEAEWMKRITKYINYNSSLIEQNLNR